MKLVLPPCGIGDAIALTAAIREYHVSFPNEPIEVAPCEYMAVFQGNPHVSPWGGALGKIVYLETERYNDVGNIAVSLGLQMGCHVLDSTPELYQVPKARDVAPDVDFGGDYRVIAVDPHARALSRRWIYERWCELVTSLRAAGFTVIQVGKSVAGHYGELPDSRPLPVDESFVNELTLHETAGVIRACDLFIGVDSGGAHLAAAVGTPQVTIYSRSSWQSRAYWNTTPVYFPAKCPVMCNRECSRPPVPCMEQIHARHVFDAALLALRRFPHAAQKESAVSAARVVCSPDPETCDD